MAKKKTKRRRRRVGALSFGKKGAGLKLAAVAGGFFLGDAINGAIDKIVTKMMPASTTTTTTTSSTANTVAVVGEIGLGGLLLLKKIGSGGTATALQIGGGVLAGAGLRRALKVMGIMSGYQSVPVIGKHRMGGYQKVPVIGRANTPPQLSGKMPAQLAGSNGYRVNGYRPHGSGVMGGIGAVEGGSGVNNSNGSGYMA